LAPCRRGRRERRQDATAVQTRFQGSLAARNRRRRTTVCPHRPAPVRRAREVRGDSAALRPEKIQHERTRGTAGLARFLVSGYSRVPAPPPRMMPSTFCERAGGLRAAQEVTEACSQESTQARDSPLIAPRAAATRTCVSMGASVAAGLAAAAAAAAARCCEEAVTECTDRLRQANSGPAARLFTTLSPPSELRAASAPATSKRQSHSRTGQDRTRERQRRKRTRRAHCT